MYAILDIEATGGKKGEEDIIEVAIYRYNEGKVVDQLISLVSPERKIDNYVQKLTQITPKMVKTAPKFHELAKRIIEITEGTILVGHNVDFDYRMLKQEFKKLGYAYYRETIDTVPLSEKAFPEASSYSLGKLSKELGIPVSDRHRAAGDARATLELFKLLLEKDILKNISGADEKKKGSSQKFASVYEDLPNSIGLVYFLNSNKEVFYLTRSQNIAQTTRKILTGKSGLSNRIRIEFESIRHETTGNELISWIKEANEINRLQPKLNQNIKRFEFPYSIYVEFENKYKIITISRTQKKRNDSVFKIMSLKMGQKMLSLITEEFQLCPKLNGISPEDLPCLSYEVGECYGACEQKESADSYNSRVDEFLEKIKLENKNILIIEDGRTLGESSFVWVNDGVCVGYGYYELHHQIKDRKRIKERMTEVETDSYIDSVVKGFLFTEKYRELITLPL